MIRKANPGDVEKMMDLMRLNNPDPRVMQRIKKKFESAFDKHEFAPTYFVYELDGVIVSVGGVSPLPINYRAYGLHSLCTHPEHRGKGFGAELVKSRIDYVKALRREPEDDYLIFLSTVIPDYFKRFGFVSVEQFNVNKSQVMILRV